MLKRIVVIVLAGIFASALAATPLIAQDSAYPVADEGVRGSGSIPTKSGNLGMFDINVARSGRALIGGFKYQEVSTDNSTAGHFIYSQMITGLVVTGNRATVYADGYWNGMPALITIEALDDLNDDWFHISARPKGPITIMIIYDEAGGVKGDLEVYKNVQPALYAKGEGAIAVRWNIGKFSFRAESTGGAVKGSISYTEYNPMATSIFPRPPVRIYVPAIKRLVVNGNVAFLGGPGTLNGRPALIEVKAVDNSMFTGPTAKPDEFHITASPANALTVNRLLYQAGGPLKSGDVSVGRTIP